MRSSHKKSIGNRPAKPNAGSPSSRTETPSFSANGASPAKIVTSAREANQSSGSYGSRGNRGLELSLATTQKTVLVQKTTLRLEKYFTETCLPRTKEIAFGSSDVLLPLVRSYPSLWSFIDKVVVMLAPKFREEVEAYYANEGASMEEMFKLSQIQYLDELLARDLSEKIDDIRSGR